MFTEANTEGFNAAQLKTLNAALQVRIERGEDEKSASDAINNAWIDGATVSDLTKPYTRRHRIKGDWMDDGFLRDIGPRWTMIEIVDGVAYDIDDYGHRGQKIEIDAEGNLRAWGAGVSFSPDQGEMQRIGLSK